MRKTFSPKTARHFGEVNPLKIAKKLKQEQKRKKKLARRNPTGV